MASSHTKAALPRGLLQILGALGLVALVLVIAAILAPAAHAQEYGVTFNGMPVEGPADLLDTLFTEGVNPEVTMNAELQSAVLATADCSNLRPLRPTQGVWDRTSDGWYLLRESVYRTQMADGYYMAALPDVTAGEHGDWPPHLLQLKFEATPGVTMTPEIAYRLAFEIPDGGCVRVSFRFNRTVWPQDTNVESALTAAYAAQGSGHRMGVFTAPSSTNPLTATVNAVGGLYGACSNCQAHTALAANAVGGALDTSDVTHFGPATVGAPVLILMYAVPYELGNEPGAVLIEATEGGKWAFWTGVLDPPASQ